MRSTDTRLEPLVKVMHKPVSYWMQRCLSEHSRHEIWRHVRYADGPMFNHVSLLRLGHVLP